MTLFDGVFLFCVLIAALLGIGGAVHLAYSLEKKRCDEEDENSYIATPKKTQSTKDTRKNADNGTKTKKTEDGDESNALQGRMNRQGTTSFSEFECQFTGEERDEKLERLRQGQDAAYNCLEKRVDNQ